MISRHSRKTAKDGADGRPQEVRSLDNSPANQWPDNPGPAVCKRERRYSYGSLWASQVKPIGQGSGQAKAALDAFRRVILPGKILPEISPRQIAGAGCRGEQRERARVRCYGTPIPPRYLTMIWLFNCFTRACFYDMSEYEEWR